jgi:hypothetical protein
MTDETRRDGHDSASDTGRRSFGPLEGDDIDAFEDPTRAAPIGPTRGAEIRDLSGTPNEGLTAGEDLSAPPND